MRRQRMSPAKDRKVFRNTANRTRTENVPGRIIYRGGRRR